jgi:cold shock CspA family protein
MHGMGWGMMNQAMVTMMKGEFEKDKSKHVGFANFTTISGTVKSVNLTRGFIVVTSDGKDYNVFVKKEYVRTSDGVLVFGGWILGNVKQGNSIEVKGFSRNSNILAVEIVWNGNTYQIPAYYMYVLSTGS